MKKIILIICFLFPFKALSDSANVSEIFSNLIPGEGYTESSVEWGSGEIDFEILAVRDISENELSNLFSQISLHTQEINEDNRLITNLGIGYRSLSQDKSSMFGINTFFDYDLEGHARGSIGFEAKAAILDFTANSYHKLTNMQTISSTEEQVLSGYEINLASQIPYMPWSKVNYQSYMWENEKASADTEGSKISLEMSLSPTIQFDIIGDYSDNNGVEDVFEYKLSFHYPPRDNRKTLKDGFIASTAFEKENVEAKLKEPVRRSNNLIVEVQGSIIITSK